MGHTRGKVEGERCVASSAGDITLYTAPMKFVSHMMKHFVKGIEERQRSRDARNPHHIPCLLIIAYVHPVLPIMSILSVAYSLFQRSPPMLRAGIHCILLSNPALPRSDPDTSVYTLCLYTFGPDEPSPERSRMTTVNIVGERGLGDERKGGLAGIGTKEDEDGMILFHGSGPDPGNPERLGENGVRFTCGLFRKQSLLDLERSIRPNGYTLHHLGESLRSIQIDSVWTEMGWSELQDDHVPWVESAIDFVCRSP